MYVFPSNYELSEIAPALIARWSEVRVGLQIMPIREVQAAMVEWDQKDNYFGLQQLRGLDGSPSYVRPVGTNRYAYEPGVYGDYMTVTETELTSRAGGIMGITHIPIQVTDLVRDRQDQLILRELDRIEYMNWTLLTTGTFSVASPSGVVFTDTFALQTHTTAVTWTGNPTTATPLVDFRAVGLLGRGKGAHFGAGAKAYMNKTTSNNLLANTNSADLGGKRITIGGGGGDTPLSVNDINRIMLDQDCAQIEVYDEGYYDDKKVWQLYIPNGTVVFVGKRQQGQRIGEYVKTRNAVNPDMAPGSYSFVNDFTIQAGNTRRVPPHIEVHQGHNGGPLIYYPGSVVVMTGC